MTVFVDEYLKGWWHNEKKLAVSRRYAKALIVIGKDDGMARSRDELWHTIL